MTVTSTAPVLDLDVMRVVLRGVGFVAEGIQRERGEVLDISDWRRTTVNSMVTQRMLGMPSYSLNETVARCECGRLWENEERSASHACPARKAGD